MASAAVAGVVAAGAGAAATAEDRSAAPALIEARAQTLFRVFEVRR
jgi:hypothetical protein